MFMPPGWVYVFGALGAYVIYMLCVEGTVPLMP